MEPLDLDALEAACARAAGSDYVSVWRESLKALIAECRRLREQVVDQLCAMGRQNTRILEFEALNRCECLVCSDHRKKLPKPCKLTDKRRKENR